MKRRLALKYIVKHYTILIPAIAKKLNIPPQDVKFLLEFVFKEFKEHNLNPSKTRYSIPWFLTSTFHLKRVDRYIRWAYSKYNKSFPHLLQLFKIRKQAKIHEYTVLRKRHTNETHSTIVPNYKVRQRRKSRFPDLSAEV